MIFNKYLKRYCMEDISILRKEDFEFFDRMVFNDGGKTFNELLYAPENHVLIFDRGIVIFTVYDTDSDRVCLVYILYKAKDSSINWNVAYNEFLKCLKSNGCTKMLMYTKMKPEFWIDKYQFKLKRYEMELDL